MPASIIYGSQTRLVSFVGRAGSFLIPGSAAQDQPLACVTNAAGSAVIVALRKVKVTSTQTVANLTRPPNYYLTRATGTAAGGTAHGKPGSDTGQSSSSSVTVRYGASADGTVSAITGLTVTPARLAARFGTQLYTAVGVAQPVAADLIGDAPIDSDYPPLIRAGDQIALVVTAAAAADNLATRFFAVEIVWEEFTYG